MSQVQLQELDAVTNAVELDIAFWNSEAFDLVRDSCGMSSAPPMPFHLLILSGRLTWMIFFAF